MWAGGWRLEAGGRSARPRAVPNSIPTYSPQPTAHSRARSAQGFTLVELVIAISIGAIVLSFAAMFISAPTQIYAAQARQATLVDSADSVLRLMARDIRRALPNSLRVVDNGSVVVLELLSTVDAVRYRDIDSATSNDDLDFGGPDTQFTTLGKFSGITRPWTTTTHYLSIYNVGIAGANAYDLSDVITPAGTSITITDGAAGEDRITLTLPGMQFAYASPARRVYLVSGPVTYLCNKTAGTLLRYSGYSIQSTQPATHTALTSAGASNAPVANGISDCDFNYDVGTAQRAGLVTLDITLSNTAAGTSTEQVRLLHQVHVENVP